ncbi:uncharacterized protein LOC121964587 [Plectropomus leopardus]|uniref:uncharacterized protein LOC121964587 n=1 Tax=Plectropomus leopardus TaxID=160734 RepID=UPI001C4A7DA0|nr:uncharacterized protein LOC121964587 [Plectropomus leopardus]
MFRLRREAADEGCSGAHEVRRVSVCGTLRRRPRSRMAAVTELCFLLFALINNIHAQQLISIKRERDSYSFSLPEEADSCLISRCVGEEKLVLLNTSDLWSRNSTAPEDLKQRLSVISTHNISFYNIHNLTHSDSGPYREECWTDGRVTHDKTTTVIVCSHVGGGALYSVTPGDTGYLPCEGATDHQDVLWLKRNFRYEQEIWSRVFGDNETSVMDEDGGRYQVVKNTSALRVFNFTTNAKTEFSCLRMDQQQCVSSYSVDLWLYTEMIYGSEGQTAVLPCTLTDFSDDQPPQWDIDNTYDGQPNQTVSSVDQNFSLVFSSLTLNHTGVYICQTAVSVKRYLLFVCPKFGPPAVELFSEGENVTLTCKDQEKGQWSVWFYKSNRTEGRVFDTQFGQSLSRVSQSYDDGSLFVSDVSLKDTGEYWCAVVGRDGQCVSSSKTVLKYRGPFGVHSTF